jgi:radical SAM superfamily enzyme YgiQ (UPF0313 family)
VELAEYLRDIHFQPEQVQDFIPTPGSLSTCMYYTGLNPFTGEAVPSAKDRNERKMQRVLLQYAEPKNREAVIQALETAGRKDLIGVGPSCLVQPQHREPRKKSAPGPEGRTRSGKPDRRK